MINLDELMEDRNLVILRVGSRREISVVQSYLMPDWSMRYDIGREELMELELIWEMMSF